MFTVRISLSKYGQLPSSFQAVNLIFHFMINSSKLGWFYKRHHLPHCVACNTIPLKDKHPKTASRMVTLCQHECGNAIKSQLRTERSICTSFSGSFLITCTRPMSLYQDWSFADFTVGRETNSWITASYTNILTWTWRWWVTNSWMNWHEERDYWAFSESFHYIITIFKIKKNVLLVKLL